MTTQTIVNSQAPESRSSSPSPDGVLSQVEDTLYSALSLLVKQRAHPGTLGAVNNCIALIQQEREQLKFEATPQE